MDRKKNIIQIGAIYGILYCVYNIAIFMIFKTHMSVFWISYGFMTVAFIAHIASIFLAFKTADVETAFFGIPLASFSLFYLCAQFSVSTIFMTFQGIGTTIPVIIQLIMLAVFLIISIISIMARDAVKEIGSNIKTNVTTLKSLNVDIDMILSNCHDPELKSSLRKLSETIKYSDPMTNDAISELEERIKRKISELRVLSENDQVAEAKKSCSELEIMYIERNKRLLISK